MLTGELKKTAINIIWGYIQQFQERRARITDEQLKIFMDGSRNLRLGTRYNWTDAVSSFLGLLIRVENFHAVRRFISIVFGRSDEQNHEICSSSKGQRAII
jgi:hypothetical protein